MEMMYDVPDQVMTGIDHYDVPAFPIEKGNAFPGQRSNVKEWEDYLFANWDDAKFTHADIEERPNGEYWYLDGNTCRKVRIRLGFRTIPARIYRNLTSEQREDLLRFFTLRGERIRQWSQRASLQRLGQNGVEPHATVYRALTIRGIPVGSDAIVPGFNVSTGEHVVQRGISAIKAVLDAEERYHNVGGTLDARQYLFGTEPEGRQQGIIGGLSMLLDIIHKQYPYTSTFDDFLSRIKNAKHLPGTRLPVTARNVLDEYHTYAKLPGSRHRDAAVARLLMETYNSTRRGTHQLQWLGQEKGGKAHVRTLYTVGPR